MNFFSPGRPFFIRRRATLPTRRPGDPALRGARGLARSLGPSFDPAVARSFAGSSLGPAGSSNRRLIDTFLPSVAILWLAGGGSFLIHP